jgi:geranylgeranyl pyrophosphate synthase
MYWVTGQYSFALPLHFALTAAGKPWISLRGGVDTIALHLGTIFQVIDDILGLVGDSQKTGKSASNDIEQGKKTLPLYYAYQKATTAEKKKLEVLIGKKKLSDKEIADARTILENTGAILRARKDVEHAYQQLQELLTTSQHFRGKPAQFLLGFAEYMMGREG